MVSMFRVCLPALLVSLCFAQEPADLFQKAPPDIDHALRARISQFYQDYVDGKYRQAESLVAPDTKDYYYDSNKPKILSFEIRRIEYSDNFTKAKATMLCEQYVMMPGFAGKPLKVPVPSRWKVVDGQWYWYVDQNDLRMTPFGKMNPGPQAGGGVDVAAEIRKNSNVAALAGEVKVDRTAVQLKAVPGATEAVHVVNHMPGAVTLSLGGASLDAVEIKLEPKQLRSGEKGVLSFHFKPGKALPTRPVTIELRVDQTNQVIPIRLAVSRS
jgi:hypothetical protein